MLISTAIYMAHEQNFPSSSSAEEEADLDTCDSSDMQRVERDDHLSTRMISISRLSTRFSQSNHSYSEHVSPSASTYSKRRSGSLDLRESLRTGTSGRVSTETEGQDIVHGETEVSTSAINHENDEWLLVMEQTTKSVSSISPLKVSSAKVHDQESALQRSMSTSLFNEAPVGRNQDQINNEPQSESAMHVRLQDGQGLKFTTLRRPVSMDLFETTTTKRFADRVPGGVSLSPSSPIDQRISRARMTESSSLAKSRSYNIQIQTPPGGVHSPMHGATTPSSSSAASVPRMSALVETLDPRLDVNFVSEDTPEQRMLAILDGATLHLFDNESTPTFQEVREQLRKRRVKNLALITISHFLGDRVSDQYHETLSRVKTALGSDDFHVLVIGFGPEKFIQSFCTNLGLHCVDIFDPATVSSTNYNPETNVFVVSDPIRYIYNIMTAYQVGRVTPVLPKGRVASSSVYSKSFRVYSKLTAPTTTGSGKQYLAWLVLDLEGNKVLHFEIDSETCKY